MSAAISPVPGASARACLAAATATAAEMVLLAGLTGGGPIGFPLLFLLIVFVCALILAALHLLLVGLPLYWLLRRHGPVAWPISAACGFLIGGLPFTLLASQTGAAAESLLLWGIPGLAGGLAFGLRVAREEPDIDKLHDIFA